MKKLIIIGLILLMLVFVACQPTPPSPPGFDEKLVPIGEAAGFLGNTQTPIVDGRGLMNIEPEDGILTLNPTENGQLKVAINGIEENDFVYGAIYTCLSSCDVDNTAEYTSHALTGDFYDDVWIRGSDAQTKLTINRNLYRLNSNNVLAYVCRMVDSGIWGINPKWDCNNDGQEDNGDEAWLLREFKLYPECEDSDRVDETTVLSLYPTREDRPEIEYNYVKFEGGPDGIYSDTYVKGTIEGVDGDGIIIDSQDECIDGRTLKEYGCSKDGEYEVFKYSDGFNCRNICSDGACLDLDEGISVTKGTETVFTDNIGRGLKSTTNIAPGTAKLTMPSLVQLSSNEEIKVNIPIQSTHSATLRQFAFARDDFDLTNEEIGGMDFSENSDYGPWIADDANRVIEIKPGREIQEQLSNLKSMGDKAAFGKNKLYIYACDRKSSPRNSVDCKYYSKEITIVPSCFDSDGEDINTTGQTQGILPGTTPAEEGRYSDLEDECIARVPHSSTVREYYCAQPDTNGIVYIASKDVDCGQGNACFKGRCEIYDQPDLPTLTNSTS